MVGDHIGIMENNARKIIYYDWNELRKYRKKKITVHFIKSVDVKKEGEQILLHTLEGDVEIVSSKDIFIMIGKQDDIYPIPRELFESKYQIMDTRENLEIVDVCERNGIDSTKVRECKLIKDSFVYGKKVEEEFTVYTKHCDSFLYGEAGDYYVVSAEDIENVYVIKENIMEETYELVDAVEK